MKRKLNYIFSQVIDNYQEAYKDNRPFYIGLGLLFIALNVCIYGGIYVLDFRFFQDLIHRYNMTYLLYVYLLLLMLPSLATLKEKEGPLNFPKILSENAKIILIVIGLAIAGFFLMGVCKKLFDEGIFTYLERLLGIVGNVLTVFVILSLLKSAIQKEINLLEALLEAFVITALLFVIIREFQNIFIYGFMRSFSYIFETDLGELILTPVFFVLVNLLLSPLLVCILTTVVRYEKAEEVVLETAENEEL